LQPTGIHRALRPTQTQLYTLQLLFQKDAKEINDYWIVSTHEFELPIKKSGIWTKAADLIEKQTTNCVLSLSSFTFVQENKELFASGKQVVIKPKDLYINLKLSSTTYKNEKSKAIILADGTELYFDKTGLSVPLAAFQCLLDDLDFVEYVSLINSRYIEDTTGNICEWCFEKNRQQDMKYCMSCYLDLYQSQWKMYSYSPFLETETQSSRQEIVFSTSNEKKAYDLKRFAERKTDELLTGIFNDDTEPGDDVLNIVLEKLKKKIKTRQTEEWVENITLTKGPATPPSPNQEVESE